MHPLRNLQSPDDALGAVAEAWRSQGRLAMLFAKRRQLNLSVSWEYAGWLIMGSSLVLVVWRRAREPERDGGAASVASCC